jgi:hypothetical protein
MVNKFEPSKSGSSYRTKTITSFIKSSNRASNEKSYNFSLDYPDGILTCGADEYMEINVISFDMINTMYNINDTNNQFIIRRGTTDTTYTIPVGNYSVKTFLEQLRTENDPHITISYNTAQNTYTFKKNSTSQLHYFIPHKIWGIVNMIPTIPYEITTEGFNTGYVNLVNYSKIILRTEGINYYYSNIENYGASNNSTLSNIIFWACKSDIEPFKVIKYNNEDAGRSYNYRIENKEINNLTLHLKNENNEFITDAPDYLLALQFNFYKIDDNIMKLTMISINKLLNEIYTTLIFGLKRLNLLT